VKTLYAGREVPEKERAKLRVVTRTCVKEVVGQADIVLREVGARRTPSTSNALVPDHGHEVREARFEAGFLEDSDATAARYGNRVLPEELVDKVALGTLPPAPKGRSG